ncbi:MAG: BMP family ABC transporter substrate-binding protein [Clostridia bacterium]|nr:BMP family ABC transporter substrate-binding protein [Clostridia bacterium]
MKLKKILSIFLLFAVLLSVLTSCGYSQGKQKSEETMNYSLITDTSGKNDFSSNQACWEALTKLKEVHPEIELEYIEPTQEVEFLTGIDILADNKSDVIVAGSALLTGAVAKAAAQNPDIKYLLAGSTLDEIPQNLTTVTFRSHEAAFLTGYIAGRTTTTNKVGFIGGMDNVGSYQLESGYEAGVAYAARELGKNIEVMIQYAESYSDMSKGRSVASKMYLYGCDIIFQNASAAGTGVIEEAKARGKYVIGSITDQSVIAPDNILTSAVVNTDKAVLDLCEKMYNNEDVGAKNFDYGLKLGFVGIPTENKNVDTEVYNSAMELKASIENGTVVPPSSRSELKEFKANL